MSRDYILNKMISPKLLIIDNPGIIISRHFKKLNGPYQDMRLSFTFEDFYCKLYKKTVKKIGKKRTKDLWYNIGKKFSVRYLLFNESFSGRFSYKTRSKQNFDLAIKHLQSGYCAAGMSVCKNMEYDLSKKKFFFQGEDSTICRKINDYSLMEGMLSGSITSLLGKNIEATSKEVSKGVFRISIDSDIKKRCILKPSPLRFCKEYKLNFKKKLFNSRLHSLKDFIMFGHIKLEENKKTRYLGKTLIGAEFSFPEIFARDYYEAGLSEIFSESTTEFSKELFSEVIDNKLTKKEKMSFFRNTASALGYGQLFIKKNKGSIVVDFLDPLFLKFELTYLANFILGFLNYIYPEDLILSREERGKFVYEYKK